MRPRDHKVRRYSIQDTTTVLCEGPLISGVLIGGEHISGVLIGGDRISGVLNGGDLISGVLIRGNLISGVLIRENLISRGPVEGDLISGVLLKGTSFWAPDLRESAPVKGSCIQHTFSEGNSALHIGQCTAASEDFWCSPHILIHLT